MNDSEREEYKRLQAKINIINMGLAVVDRERKVELEITNQCFWLYNNSVTTE